MIVVFVLPSFAGGGAERVMLSLLTEMHADRFDPVLVVMDGRGPLADLVPDAVPVIDLATDRLRRALVPLVRALRKLNPHAIVASHGYVNLALIAMRPLLPGGSRLVLREANTPSLSLPHAPYPKLMSLGYRWLYRHADLVLASSDRMAAEFLGEYCVPAERVQVLPNPVDIQWLRSAATPPRRREGPGRRFIAAGRLNRQKGFDRLLDRLAELPSDTHLTILGDGPEQVTLQAQVARLGIGDRVTFGGFEPCPWPWYAGADAFVLPSRWEGMPNAALEALACGTRVIATPESGGIGELVAEADQAAVNVIEFGDQFVTEMIKTNARPSVDLPRQCLLPDRYDARTVGEAFSTLIDERR